MHIGGNHGVDELARMAKKHHPRLRKRFQAIIMAKQGMSAARIARTLGCSGRAVQLWASSYNQGGVDALIQWWKPANGEQPSSVAEPQAEAVV
jgi:transposase